ncbi:MAG: hypothetical protein ABJ360_04015 [Roseobacter sp.]
MHKHRTTECCSRPPGDKELSLVDAGYDPVEMAVLEIARCYWQTFAVPQSQSWLYAISYAERHFGGTASNKILSAVQAMRMSRISCFRFNNPVCPECAAIVSEHERQFINTFIAMRSRRRGSAETHAMILCEGNDTRSLLDRMDDLVQTICPERVSRREQESA